MSQSDMHPAARYNRVRRIIFSRYHKDLRNEDNLDRTMDF